MVVAEIKQSKSYNAKGCFLSYFPSFFLSLFVLCVCDCVCGVSLSHSSSLLDFRSFSRSVSQSVNLVNQLMLNQLNPLNNS